MTLTELILIGILWLCGACAVLGFALGFHEIVEGLVRDKEFFQSLGDFQYNLLTWGMATLMIVALLVVIALGVWLLELGTNIVLF